MLWHFTNQNVLNSLLFLLGFIFYVLEYVICVKLTLMLLSEGFSGYFKCVSESLCDDSNKKAQTFGGICWLVFVDGCLDVAEGCRGRTLLQNTDGVTELISKLGTNI